MPQDLDRELVARSLRGDGRAFRDLLERHHAVAYAVVRAILRGSDEVEDVMQVVYMKTYQALGAFRGDSKFSTWLYQIARREAIDVASRRRRETTDVDDVALEAPHTSAPDLALRERDTREWVDRAMGEIDAAYRTAIELRYMAEKSYDEIAEIMGVPEGTAKTYVHRGKAELKRILSRPDWRSRKAEN